MQQTNIDIVLLPLGRLGMKPGSLSRDFGRLRKVVVAIRAAIADVARLGAFAGHLALAWGRGQ